MWVENRKKKSKSINTCDDITGLCTKKNISFMVWFRIHTYPSQLNWMRHKINIDWFKEIDRLTIFKDAKG